MASKLLSAPGVRHEYSNVGYSLLAAVVELASGRSYERYLRENLFAPAGMTETGYLIPKWKREKLAVGYRKGWVVQKTPRGTSLIRHNGGNPFFFADFRRYTDENVVLIVATNSGARIWESSSAPIFRAIFAPAAVSK